MEVNKVVYNGDTLLDLTSDTVTPQTLLSGATAHAANGQSISGAVDLSGKADKVANATAGNFAGLDASGNLIDSGKSASDFIVQSDWNQTDSTADDYIKNKPTLGTASALDVPASGNASSSQVVKGNDSRLTNSRTPTNHASNKVTSLTGYSKPSSTSAITTSDSLNTALGKLEKGLDGKADNLMTNYSIAVLEEAIAITDTKDEAIGKLEKGLQNRAKTVDITDTIQASSWTGASAPYSYTLVITGSGYGITSSMKPIIDVVPSDTVQTGLDQIEQFGYISKAVTGTNTITFYCYEDKPDIDLPISIKLIW